MIGAAGSRFSAFLRPGSPDNAKNYRRSIYLVSIHEPV